MDTAVILAGGFGTRLRPLTEIMPKPLLPVAGKPVLQWTLDLLSKYGFKKAILTLSYKSDLIQKHFGNKYKDVEIVYFVEKEPLGNAGAFNFLKEHLTETFLELHGDVLMELDINKMYELHKEKKALASLALKSWGFEDSNSLSRAIVKNGLISEFQYKPKKEEAKSDLMFLGAALIEPETLNLIKDKLVADVDKDLYEPIIKQGRMGGFISLGNIENTDTIERYAKANAYWNNAIMEEILRRN